MKKNLPIYGAVTFIIILFITMIMYKKTFISQSDVSTKVLFGKFDSTRGCQQLPMFLKEANLPQPFMIDLSQKQAKGINFLYGKRFKQNLHYKDWERYDHFSTYTLDKQGNTYLTPMPFISIEPSTFNLQKNIYILDTYTAKLSIWMQLDEVLPTGSNPYGVMAVAYDCDDETLWVSTIDQTDYQTQKGRLYHIDIKTKRILQRIEGFDALTLSILHTTHKKYLLAGSAKEQGLYAFTYENQMLLPIPKKLFDLPNPNAHIRKIKVIGSNTLSLETIPFAYTLVTQTSQHYRTLYQAKLSDINKRWQIKKILTH